MPLHQWDYIFAFGVIFSMLDAFNIGANDVANSFATSVSSRSLTLRQAVLAAAVMESLGGILAGARVAGTIKNGIISLSGFQGNAGVQLLSFTCAITVSAIWLMIATKNSWPVSTTYSIVSALAGVGVAVGGAKSVQWGWNNGKGLGAIWAGMLIAPALAAAFGAVVFLITKYAVLQRKNSVKAAMIASPIYFGGTTMILTMSIVYKGSPQLKLDKLPQTTIALAIVLTGVVIAALSAIFWLPFVYCKVVRKDYTIRWFHFFYGPLLWKRQAPADAAEMDNKHVPDYRAYRPEDHHPELSQTTPPVTAGNPTNVLGEAGASGRPGSDDGADGKEKTLDRDAEALPTPQRSPLAEVEKDAHPIIGNWYEPKNLAIIFKYKIFAVLTHGQNVDIHAMQGAGDNRISEMHARVQSYPNETEHLFSFLQVMTACTASFAHGSNDLANAVGPFSTIYFVWKNSRATTSNTPTEVWQLVVGAAFLCLGLATYGYNIMRVLGNRVTAMSPSRGFSMELGASITVLLASQYGIPVSSTMCIVGATIGVGLCSGDWKAVNWRAIGWIALGWVLTVPVVGTLSGCLTGMFLNAPHF